MKKKLVSLVLTILMGIFVGGITFYCLYKNNAFSKITYEKKYVCLNEKNLNLSFLQLESNGKNIIYSPLSIKNALAMLNEGADGNTKEEINNLLKDVPVNKYNDVKNKVSFANAIFIKDGYQENMKSDYISNIGEKYGAEVKYDDFRNSNNLNKWVNEKTFNLIRDPFGDLSEELKVVLINALAIDLSWEYKIDTNDTYGADFYLESGEILEATTMKNTYNEGISYYQDDDLTLISLPLEKTIDSNLEFVAIMPTNLKNYTESLTSELLQDDLAKMKEITKETSLYIPKFNFDYSLDFENDLIYLGIKDAFDEYNANFSRMSNNFLYVDEAIHKATIEFSEDGIKAAAITALMMNDTMLPADGSVTIKIDKPFMFLIKNKENDDIWFIGNVFEPNHWEEDAKEYLARE